MNKRLVQKCLSLLLAVWLLASPAQFVLAELDTVTVSSEDDLLKFAKSCALDTWSQGKTVLLTADIELTVSEFDPIPTFGGVFKGQGHTVSGLRITADGSAQGLFRYLQSGGVIQDLTVEGTVAPGGTRSIVGGIVGDNSGTVQNCAFHGTVQGDGMVGGIAGRSNGSGQIIGCTVSGSVSGSSATGGVAGRSLGLLLKCENSAGVNLTQTEARADLLNVDAGSALDGRAATDDEAYHLLRSCSDTGGIVGWSGGVVQSCVNNGAVGYPHVGYNSGGIAGRQNGYLAGCVNNAAVNGRKDVGGIVGQAEPFLLLDPSEDSIERLQNELDTLDLLIDRAINDAQSMGDSISALLESMNCIRPREYDGSHIVFSGINPAIQLQPHQVNAIAHVLYGGNTLLAHEVGAGKSFEMIASAMEGKRLGLCSKSHYPDYQLRQLPDIPDATTGEEVVAHNYVMGNKKGNSYSYANDLSAWDPYSVATAYHIGLVSGVDSTGRCDPWAPITRAQVVQMLYNMGITQAGQLKTVDPTSKPSNGVIIGMF